MGRSLGFEFEVVGFGGFEMEVGTKSLSRWSVPVKKVASDWARIHTDLFLTYLLSPPPSRNRVSGVEAEAQTAKP